MSSRETTSPSNHFHLPVQKWFVANDLIAGDYTASEEIVDVLGLDEKLQTADFRASVVEASFDYHYQEFDEYVAKGP